jgi:tetratricopeptide (TPR) repeat protein
MADSSSLNPVRDSELQDAAEREARIEELLLSGLDLYFAGQYERAISVWTRIVFLDRHHDRARAYIERARSALAERQRQSDELLHTGVAAYEARDVDKARDLLTRAVEQGSDTAHLFLDRLNRVAAPGVAADLRIDPRPPRVRDGRRAPLAPPRRGWAAGALAAVAVAAAMLLGGLPIGTWLSGLQGGVPVRTAQSVPEEPLPVVRAAETALVRARGFYRDGRLRDALRVLDRIGPGDPARAEADLLRADIQRDLLAAAGLAVSSPGATEQRP